MNYKLLDKCSIQEKYLVNWLSSYGNYSSFSLKDIEYQTTNRRTAIEFKSKFYDWTQLVKNEADLKPFFTKIRNRTVLTNTYYNEYLKWVAFKNFLLNYRTISSGNFKDVELWKKYFPYALALGIGSEIIKFSPSMEDNDFMYTDPVFYNYYYLNYICTDYCYDFEHHLIQNTTNNDNNNFSSGSGFGDGGGFTS